MASNKSTGYSFSPKIATIPHASTFAQDHIQKVMTKGPFATDRQDPIPASAYIIPKDVPWAWETELRRQPNATDDANYNAVAKKYMKEESK